MAAEPLPANLALLSLADVQAALAGQRLPPVEKWNPPHCGHSAMRIARDGQWYHEGGLISRAAMVRMFASILRKEAGGRFVLVTPVEKLDIDVEDAPFVAVELKVEGEGKEMVLAFRLNTGDAVIAGPEHRLRVEDRGGEPAPYIHVRGGMDARIARAPFYELAELALAGDAMPPGVWSQGVFFALGDGA